MFTTIYKWPDDSYATSMMRRYQANPGKNHCIVVKNILQYLKRTKVMFLVYVGKEDISVKGYADESFQTGRDNF